MDIFENFTEWFNNDVGSGFDFDPNVSSLGLDQSFARHYVEERQKQGVRMSNLGKPAAVTALIKLGYIEPEPKGKLRYIFYLGDVWENTLEVFLKEYGFEIVSSQGICQWNGISGSYDFIVADQDGQKYLVEAKTMSGNYARIFRKEPDDDRGYLTQMALYQDCVKLPAVWLCMDKSTGEVFTARPNAGVLTERLQRASNVLQRLSRVNVLGDVLQAFRTPPARPEIYRKEPTGKYILPVSMAYSPYASALYKLTDGTNQYGRPTRYVEDYADEHHMKKELEFLTENGALVYVD